MFDRKQVKENAKAALKGNLGWAILLTIVISLLTRAASATVIGAIIVSGPLTAGIAIYYTKLYRRENVSFTDGFGGFSNFLNNMVAGILVTLFTMLWSMLFVIPGIIKGYSYAMTYYILNDHPEYTATQAITASREMMKGHKWQLFVLQLSFIGWNILSVMTCGILEVVYVGPYRAATMAGFYDAIKGE